MQQSEGKFLQSVDNLLEQISPDQVSSLEEFPAIPVLMTFKILEFPLTFSPSDNVDQGK